MTRAERDARERERNAEYDGRRGGPKQRKGTPGGGDDAEADQDVKRERARVLSGQRLEAGVFRLGDVIVQKELVDVENHFHSDPSASSSASMSSNIGIASAGFAESDTRHPPAPASRRSASSREAPNRARLKPNPCFRNACTSAGDTGAFEAVVLPPVRSPVPGGPARSSAPPPRAIAAACTG